MLSLAAMGSDYRGCSNAPAPPDGVPLPMSDEGCLVDADCGVDACFILECVAGECVPVGARVDGDGDGYAPPPCGMDCSDTESDVFPGSAEVCDGRDQNCNGTVDEDAPGALSQSIEDGLSDAILVGLDTGFAIVGRTADGALAGYVLGRDGSTGAIATLVGATDPPIERFAAAGDGARVVVAFALGGRAPFRVELERAGTDLAVIAEPEPLATSGDTTSLAVHVLGGRAFVAFDTIEGGDEVRSLWSEGSGALTPLLAGDAGPFLADDGERLVATSGDARIDFLAPDGSILATQTLPGPFASGQAIASSGGAVVAAYRDSFDHNLTTVTTSTIRAPSAAPFGMREDILSVHTLTEGVLVTRIDASEPRAWILAPDLRTYLATFTGGQLSPIARAPDRMSAASDVEGTSAILSSYEGVSAAALLRCPTAP